MERTRIVLIRWTQRRNVASNCIRIDPIVMATARMYVEKLLFPGWTPAQRRRHMRFFLLALLLGVLLSAGFGAALYLLNSQGRI